VYLVFGGVPYSNSPSSQEKQGLEGGNRPPQARQKPEVKPGSWQLLEKPGKGMQEGGKKNNANFESCSRKKIHKISLLNAKGKKWELRWSYDDNDVEGNCS